MFPWFAPTGRTAALCEALSFTAAVAVELGRTALEAAVVRWVVLPELQARVRRLEARMARSS
jgi:hypothetical protein